jgi:ribonuclease HI
MVYNRTKEETLAAGWKFHPLQCSNNEAELDALQEGLKRIRLLRKPEYTQLTVIGDSQFVQRLTLTTYKSKKFKKSISNIHAQLASFKQVVVHHTRRQWNTMADHLSNQAMDFHSTESMSMEQLKNTKHQNFIKNDEQFKITLQKSNPNLGSRLSS